ncbi:MAG TPA: curlin repeat-containing protein, partial [Ignavibacteriaceae bacterium]|nr:curlin repeat-containing protein [Ignavibacteriaceae bacterium]
MRKLFALLTVVFFAGFMMAQNTGTVSQTGSDNHGIVDQIGSGNVGTITTVGNEATDNVQKWWNYYGINQVMFAKGIRQTGTNNSGSIDQTGNKFAAAIGQLGIENSATITQIDPTLNVWGQNNA